MTDIDVIETKPAEPEPEPEPSGNPQVSIPDPLKHLFLGPARIRVAHGGRGSGKTRSFAKMAAVKANQLDGMGKRGIILCAREYMNSLDESSLAEVKEAILSEPWLEPFFDVGEKYIKSKSGRIEFKFSGLWRNLDSIKSKARILLAWVDEADPVSEEAWIKLVPTIREENSELWITYNRERKNSATDRRFGISRDADHKVVQINFRENEWFPEVLNKERLRDKRDRPEQYNHIWEGDYLTVHEGAYFAADLIRAREENRIGHVAADPLMTFKAVWDIGGTGAKADATAIWIVQFIGKEIRLLDYYEARGQPLATHVNWLRSKNYGHAECILPHDGRTNDRVHDVSFESVLREAGFEVTVIPNQGRAAAKMRVEAARRLFGSMWFNEETTEAGRDAIGWYHEKIDQERKIGLGPEHDWSSHAADAFGLVAVAYEAPQLEKRRRAHRPVGAHGWMG